MGQVKTAVALCLALVFVAPLAHAQGAATPSKAQIDEARQRRDRGLKLYEDGAWEAALTEFQRAYDLAPTYKLLYNLALAHRQLNDYAGALRDLGRFLEEGGKDVPAKRRAEIEREMADLKARVATVTVKVNVPGAEITLDDVAIGTSPLAAAVIVNSGKRRFAAKKPGFEPATRGISLAGTDVATVELELLETPKAAPPLPPPGEDATTAPKPLVDRPFPWVLWGATGALAVGTGVVGLLTLSSSKTLASDRDSAGQTRASLDSAHDKTKKLALITDVLGVATLAVGGVALYMTVSKTSEPTVEAGVTPGGVTVRGKWLTSPGRHFRARARARARARDRGGRDTGPLCRFDVECRGSAPPGTGTGTGTQPPLCAVAHRALVVERAVAHRPTVSPEFAAIHGWPGSRIRGWHDQPPRSRARCAPLLDRRSPGDGARPGGARGPRRGGRRDRDGHDAGLDGREGRADVPRDGRAVRARRRQRVDAESLHRGDQPREERPARRGPRERHGEPALREVRLRRGVPAGHRHRGRPRRRQVSFFFRGSAGYVHATYATPEAA
jgi:hypothetical protein